MQDRNKGQLVGKAVWVLWTLSRECGLGISVHAFVYILEGLGGLSQGMQSTWKRDILWYCVWQACRTARVIEQTAQA